MKRKIMVITGRRAEYGLMRETLKEIVKNPKLDLNLVVTGNHLIKELGDTLKQIEEDGFEISNVVDSYPKDDEGASMAFSLGDLICKLTYIVKKDKPDIIVVLTDLGHALAGAIVGSHMNIPVAHVHGGDISGTIDESIRHATTKFSHIHFPATKKSAERIRQLGEEDWRIHTVGAPGLDEILNKRLLSKKELFDKYNLGENRPLFLIIQHPVTTESNIAGNQMNITMDAVSEFSSQKVILYPNADAGSKQIIDVIKKYSDNEDIKIFKNLERNIYLSILKNADVLIGNSSSGIIEAPSFKTGVVNIGNRQFGRERASNVIDVDFNRSQIISAIDKILNDKKFIKKLKECNSPYGDGQAGKRISKILAEIKIDYGLIQKKFCDIK